MRYLFNNHATIWHCLNKWDIIKSANKWYFCSNRDRWLHKKWRHFVNIADLDKNMSRISPDANPQTAQFQLWYTSPKVKKIDKPTKNPMSEKVILSLIKHGDGSPAIFLSHTSQRQRNELGQGSCFSKLMQNGIATLTHAQSSLVTVVSNKHGGRWHW